MVQEVLEVMGAMAVLDQVVLVLALGNLDPSCCCRRRNLYCCFRNLSLSHNAHMRLQERWTSTIDRRQMPPSVQ